MMACSNLVFQLHSYENHRCADMRYDDKKKWKAKHPDAQAELECGRE